MGGMDSLTRFDQAAAAASAVVAGVRPDQLDDPTPCTEWTVRQLLHHLVGGNARFAALIAGTPLPDADSTFLTDDLTADFDRSVGRLRALFTQPDGLTRLAPTPFGQQPGAFLASMRASEMLLHGWDLARATGQPTDLAPEVAEHCLEDFRRLRAANQGNTMFAPPQPIPDNAPAADRLAAYAGRTVTV
jgi:uncharacterized protein (TIGR03086 family)